MRRQGGFTLIEIMVVIAILGILGATAIPTYHTWLYRARGAEAKIMAKQILEAEIQYYLDKDKFFPSSDTSIDVLQDYPSSHPNVIQITDNLHIAVPAGHSLNYTITNLADETVYLTISSDFEIFKGYAIITYTLDKTGMMLDPDVL
jgi:prepilin-type N-terminal cleavage/methylation domain-containing protein